MCSIKVFSNDAQILHSELNVYCQNYTENIPLIFDWYYVSFVYKINKNYLLQTPTKKPDFEEISLVYIGCHS